MQDRRELLKLALASVGAASLLPAKQAFSQSNVIFDGPVTLNQAGKMPLVLQPQVTGGFQVFDLEPKPGTSLPSDLKTLNLVDNNDIILKPVENRDLTILGKKFTVKDGKLGDINPLALGGSWKEEHWAEVKW